MSVSEGTVSSSLRKRGRTSIIGDTRERSGANIGGSCDNDDNAAESITQQLQPF